MAENPWLKTPESAEEQKTRDEDIEKLGNALMSPEPDGGEKPAADDDAVKAEPDDEPKEKSELFDDEQEDDSSDDEEEVADPDEIEETSLFDDPDADSDGPQIPKGWTKGTWKRFQKVYGQRNEARERLEKAIKDVESSKALAGVLAEKYAEFEDPASQARRDISFMEALETLAGQHADVGAFAAEIVQFINTGRFRMPDATSPTPAPKIIPHTNPDPPARDERVDLIIRRDAEREVNATLDSLGVKPSFQKVIRDSILNEDGVDLTKIDRKAVIDRSRTFLRENGFTAAEVLVKPGSGQRGKAKPVTAGTGGGTASPTKKTEGDPQQHQQQQQSGAPQSVEDWNARHEQKMRELRDL